MSDVISIWRSTRRSGQACSGKALHDAGCRKVGDRSSQMERCARQQARMPQKKETKKERVEKLRLSVKRGEETILEEFCERQKREEDLHMQGSRERIRENRERGLGKDVAGQ